jgi:ATP-binding cassette, subfamily B, bacterial PglK
MQILKKILFLLTPLEQKKAGLLLIMILIMAILDTIGVASILPFIAVLTNPEIVEDNFLLESMYDKSKIFGVDNINEFIIILGVLVFFVLIISLTFKSFVTYAQLRFATMREHSIGKRLLESYLSQPYSWSLNRNSADFAKTILSEVNLMILQAVTPMINLLANAAVVIAIFILLIIIDPYVAFLISLTFGSAYWIIYKLIRGYLKNIGQERLKVNKLRFTSVNEVFGAGKEVKLGGLENTYIDKFSKTSKIFAKHQASMQVLGQLPRFAIEAVGFGGMILFILYYLFQNKTFTSALPLISLYAFAGYRVLPALQKIYISITSLRFASPALDSLCEELKLNKKVFTEKHEEILPFEKAISLKNIFYNYPNTKQSSVKNVSLQISAYSTIGLVGATGSGKTTTVDIILGLLEPQKGVLEVDGKIINNNNKKAWQKNIGYVPQYIYLTDDTISANIALGSDLKDVSQKSIERAAKAANLHEFITKDLQLGYKTVIGERGVRLSGGQRQRLGIARALYHSPKILILDEATSAMDSLTEKLIMDAINNLKKDTTIILIAHRLTTIKNCEKIFLIDKGELKDQGTYEELIKSSALFDKYASS